MSDEGYNGWKNYPTWNVNLWLGNDQDLYNETLSLAREVVEGDHPTSPHWTVEQSRRFNLADVLKEWVREGLAPDLGSSFASDLLGYAFDEVDWDEIADAWIETAGEQVTA